MWNLLIYCFSPLSDDNVITIHHTIQVSFGVDYNMSISNFSTELTITVAVLSGLSLIYAFFVTSNWNRREGKVAIEMFTIVKLVLFTIGNLSNVFFLSILGFSAWWFILYKVIMYSMANARCPLPLSWLSLIAWLNLHG